MASTTAFKLPRLNKSQDAYLPSSRYMPDGKLNVAGRWNSPGPKYMLPSCIGAYKPDPTLLKKPAYSFGTKWRDLTKQDDSPGPIYYPDSKVDRKGRSGLTAFSLSSRAKEYSLWFSPGPGSYNPEDHINAVKKTTPAYTMGTKHKHLESPSHPVGPNQYCLPNTIGHRNFCTKAKTSPAFSISSRKNFMSTTYNMDKSSSQFYNPELDFIKRKPPAWSMSGRNYPPVSADQMPGPADYHNETVKVQFPATPRITLGYKHSELCTTGLPAHYNNEYLENE